MAGSNKPLQPKPSVRQIKYQKGHLEFKLHPIWALAAFVVFLFTVGGGIFLFVDANYKGKIDNKEAEIERLNLKITNSKEQIDALQKDSAAFVSMKSKLRSGDTTGISPKEFILIDSLTQASRNNQNALIEKERLIQNLNKLNQSLTNKINNIEQQNSHKTSSSETITKLIHDTIEVIVKDTVYIGPEQRQAYSHYSYTLYSSDGFQDASGFSFGIVDWNAKEKKVTASVLRPGETDSKEYKNVAVGSSWSGTANGIKYILTLVSLKFYLNDIKYEVKVMEVP